MAPHAAGDFSSVCDTPGSCSPESSRWTPVTGVHWHCQWWLDSVGPTSSLLNLTFTASGCVPQCLRWPCHVVPWRPGPTASQSESLTLPVWGWLRATGSVPETKSTHSNLRATATCVCPHVLAAYQCQWQRHAARVSHDRHAVGDAGKLGAKLAAFGIECNSTAAQCGTVALHSAVCIKYVAHPLPDCQCASATGTAVSGCQAAVPVPTGRLQAH